MDRLVILGSKGGPAIRTGGPSPTSMLLEVQGRSYVIDCGLGVTRGLVEAGVPLASLATILITHHHSDHNLEFGNLIYTAWVAGLASPVVAYGAKGLARMGELFFDLNRFDIETRIADEGRPDLRRMLTVHEYVEGPVLDDGTVRVTALRNHHPPVVDSFALRFEFNSSAGAPRNIVFSGDTAYLPKLAEFARGADILVHEAMLGDGVDALVARVKNGSRLREHLLASHTMADDVGRIATAAGVGRLVLNHLTPADDPAFGPADWEKAVRTTWAGPLTVARDGLTLLLRDAEPADTPP